MLGVGFASRAMKFIYNLITPDYPELAAVIAPSIGNPTQEKITKILDEYDAFSRQLIGCFINTRLVAVIGVEIDSPMATIKHLSVLPEHQGLGIGRKLIQFILKSFPLFSLSAETDEEAVGFYQAMGFTCQPFEGKYGRRYQCELTME